MKVKGKTSRVIASSAGTFSIENGRETDIPDDVAAGLIGAGIVEAVSAPQIETSMASRAPEVAMTERAKAKGAKK